MTQIKLESIQEFINNLDFKEIQEKPIYVTDFCKRFLATAKNNELDASQIKELQNSNTLLNKLRQILFKYSTSFDSWQLTQHTLKTIANIKKNVDPSALKLDDSNPAQPMCKIIDELEFYLHYALNRNESDIFSRFPEQQTLLVYYYNLFSYVTYWCMDNDQQWLIERSDRLKSNVESVIKLYSAHPEMEKTLTEFLDRIHHFPKRSFLDSLATKLHTIHRYTPTPYRDFAIIISLSLLATFFLATLVFIYPASPFISGMAILFCTAAVALVYYLSVCLSIAQEHKKNHFSALISVVEKQNQVVKLAFYNTLVIKRASDYLSDQSIARWMELRMYLYMSEVAAKVFKRSSGDKLLTETIEEATTKPSFLTKDMPVETEHQLDQLAKKIICKESVDAKEIEAEMRKIVDLPGLTAAADYLEGFIAMLENFQNVSSTLRL